MSKGTESQVVVVQSGAPWWFKFLVAPGAVLLILGMLFGFIPIPQANRPAQPSYTVVEPLNQEPEANAAAAVSQDEQRFEAPVDADARSAAGSFTNTDGGDDTQYQSVEQNRSGGDVNTFNADSIVFNNSAAETAATGVEQDNTADADAEANAVVNNGAPAPLGVCTFEKYQAGEIIGGGALRYQIISDLNNPVGTSAYQTVRPSDMTPELAEQYAAENRSAELATRPAQVSCLLSEEAVAEVDCSYNYRYVRFKEETGLIGWWWDGGSSGGINFAGNTASCN